MWLYGQQFSTIMSNGVIFPTIASSSFTGLSSTVRFYCIWDDVYTVIPVSLTTDNASLHVGYCATMAVVCGMCSEVKFLPFLFQKKKKVDSISATS